MSIQHLPSVGPYTWVSKDVTRGRYRMLIYGAYNALGLIGSEMNGICVLDNEDMCVVADNLYQQSSGYFGPTDEQTAALLLLLHCSPERFCEVINSSRRNRHSIRPDTVPEAEPLFQII